MGVFPEDSSVPLKKRKTDIGPCCNGSAELQSCNHRLHYRWSQLEADRCGLNVGSPRHPLPSVDRTLHVEPSLACSHRQRLPSECPPEDVQFSKFADVYMTTDYNTFSKNGCLKLTEIEIFFLSSNMTRTSSSNWMLVYLGIGNGERFRWLRDKFFPGLSVMAFDPLDELGWMKEAGLQNSNLWKGDATNFELHVRCFNESEDVDRIKERAEGKRLLLISDVRGAEKCGGELTWNISYDQDVQWRAIQCLNPVKSLVKFNMPDTQAQYYSYAPGVILKQVYCHYGTCETRLVIDGVPEECVQYNTLEYKRKMRYHHEHLRGLVYNAKHRSGCPACLDSCFDCSVLWNTLSTYASQNKLDPNDIIGHIVKYQVYMPSFDSNWYNGWANWSFCALTQSQRWWDVVWHLNYGRLAQAIAALEAEGEDNEEEASWLQIVHLISEKQPALAERLRRELQQSESSKALIQLLGSLAEPFTLIRSYQNTLLGEAESQLDQHHSESC